MNKELKLKSTLRTAKGILYKREDRLDEHMEGYDCEDRYHRCKFTQDGYTKREYYELNCKEGERLHSRVGIQEKRINNLKIVLDNLLSV